MNRSTVQWLWLLVISLILWAVAIVLVIVGGKLLFKMGETITNLLFIGVGYA